jgi:RNA polymerase sigma factor (TIGR02999 family)
LAASAEVTRLLRAWQDGDSKAFEELIPLVYDELRHIARMHMRRERAGLTLQATALANEAYLRLVDAKKMHWRDRAHFFAMASRVMRRVLVDAARARHAEKRGGASPKVTLVEALAVPSPENTVDLVALDEALESLAAANPRKAQIVELRYFGGLTVEETAAVLKISTDTVARDWRFAKSWLKRELSGNRT